MNEYIMCLLERMLIANLHFTITSALRTLAQNESCHGSPTSQHLLGEAIDIKPYGSTTFGELLHAIHDFSDRIHEFDQLIIYSNFIHVSFGPRDRRQVIDKRK